jgi:predicted nucleic acid-binding protein
MKQKAFDLCREVDEKDFLYLALALHLDIPLLTRDIPLYNHLSPNPSVKIILFDEFLKDIEDF